MIDNKQEPIFLADLDGDILLANPFGEKFTGYSEDELTTFSVRDLFITLKSNPNPFDARHLREFSAEIYMIDALRYIVPVFLEFKEIEGNKFLGSIKPLNEREISVQPEPVAFSVPDIRPVPEQDQKDHITKTANVKHDDEFDHNVRNTLNTILGFGTVLSKEAGIVKDQKLKKYVDSIVKSGNNLKKLFNSLEDSEVEHDEISWGQTSVLQVLQKAKIMLGAQAHQNNILITIRQRTDITLLSDEFILFDIINFFVGKAIDFTRNEEVVIDFFLNDNQKEITLTIDNIGQDIPQSIIHYIKRENNKSLYDYKNPILFMYREIQSLLKNLNSLDSKIDFATGESMGEIVILKIPVRKEIDLQQDVNTTNSDEKNPDKKMYVLIVEDEKINANIFKMYIQGVANVSTAFSGNEAMNIIELNYNKGILFNVIFMDIGLPEPWDGIILKESIEKKWPEYVNIPFIAQTAYSNKNIAGRIENANFKGYLVKPINRNDVLRFIDKFSKK